MRIIGSCGAASAITYTVKTHMNKEELVSSKYKVIVHHLNARGQILKTKSKEIKCNGLVLFTSQIIETEDKKANVAVEMAALGHQKLLSVIFMMMPNFVKNYLEGLAPVKVSNQSRN
jgi:hypothetical protein